MLNVLIVYAVEEERVHLQMEYCRFYYCKTGIGKVAAAIAVEKAIGEFQPDVVMNIGTAGAVDHEIGSIHLCCRFVDRDMEKLSAFGVPCEEDFSQEVDAVGFFSNWKFDSTCNTGDTFLTTSDGTGDVFDMESFAVARVCRVHGIPFVGVKCVTDKIGENSIRHWEEKLAEAQSVLQKFVDDHPLEVPVWCQSKGIKRLIDKYKLQPHPEGGWFSEVFRSEMVLKKDGIPPVFQGDRCALTSIYYLLTFDQVSGFHRIQSPEVWYFLKGMPLLIHVVSAKGEYKCIELSDTDSGVLQYTVEENCWFAAEIKGRFGFSLVGCAVAPGFEFMDFELARYDSFINDYPALKEEVGKYLFEELPRGLF